MAEIGKGASGSAGYREDNGDRLQPLLDREALHVEACMGVIGKQRDQGEEQGVVLADQLRSLDWRSRQADIIGTAPMAVLERVLQLVGTLLSSP